MSDPSRPILVSLFLLTVVTGIVDAASVLGLGHVFTANMTGNVVFLGFAVAGQGSTSVVASLNALGSFTLGALFGGRVSRTLSARAVRLAFGVEVCLLFVAAFLGLCALERATMVLVSLLAFAMGVRNAVVRKLAVPDMTTTVLTLTITGLAADSSWAGGNNPRWRRRLLAVLMMLAGASLGAGLLPRGIGWVVGLAAVLEGVAIVVLVRHAGTLAPSTAPRPSP
jgi:uncharacterized membrane protein YoaK (UPF0700 family)